MNYITNDLQFNLPESSNYVDMTVNILKLIDHEATVVVTRAPFSEDSLQESFENQMLKLQHQVKGYKFKNKKELLLINDSVQAFEIFNEFTRGSDKVFQVQLAFAEPGEKNMIAFAFVKSSPLNEKDIEKWDFIKKSIVLVN